MVKKADEAYVSKEELLKKGFEKGSDGIWHKLNTLEMYGRRGQLCFGDKAFTADDRVAIGNQFYVDFYHSKLTPQGAVSLTKVRVDGGQYQNIPEYVINARKKFFGAIRAIPKEYVSAVCQVCLEDKKLKIPSANIRQYKHEREVEMEKLCRGLDSLIYHYKGRPKFRRRKILSYHTSDFWREFHEWCDKYGY